MPNSTKLNSIVSQCKSILDPLNALQAAQLWLQYILLLGGVNTPTPRPLHWVLSAANFAFSTVTNGSLSTDCLLSASHNSALQEIVVHLCVPLLVLLLMLLLQIIW